MTEYISRGDFTSDVAFNRYKAVLVEYKNLKQHKCWKCGADREYMTNK